LVLTQSLTVRGVIQDGFVPTHRMAFRAEMTEWPRAGSVRNREYAVDGLENAPAALRGLLRGADFGKVLRIGRPRCLGLVRTTRSA